jgi:hypothetical protein
MTLSIAIYLGTITPGNLTEENAVPYDVDGLKELLDSDPRTGNVGLVGFVADKSHLNESEEEERARLARTLLHGALEFIKFNVEGMKISYDWEGKVHHNHKITDGPEFWPEFINFYTKHKAGTYTVEVIPQTPDDSPLLLQLRIFRDAKAAAVVQVEREKDDSDGETTG